MPKRTSGGRTRQTRLPVWAAFGLDVRVVAFAACAIVLTALLFGWAPALHSIRGDLRSSTEATTRGTTAPPRARRTLVWTAAMANGWPALRARHIDPMDSLRME